VITSISGLTRVINLINGYLRTPKIDQFNKLISRINNNSNNNFITYEPDTSPILITGGCQGLLMLMDLFLFIFVRKQWMEKVKIG